MEPLSPWEQLLKRIVWRQLGEIADKKILDFGSGLGINYEDTDIVQWCGNALDIVKVYGIRTFWDLQQNQAIEQNTDWQEKMIQIELRVSEMEAFRSIAFFHHVILKNSRRGI